MYNILHERRKLYERHKLDDREIKISLYYFNRDEEVFLIYSRGMENGPGIVRDGKSSPWMAHPNPSYIGQRTTDADIQRYGTYFLNQALKNEDNDNLQDRITKLSLNDPDDPLLPELKELLESNRNQKDYITEFKRAYPGYEIIAIQGIGDLTMNLWNVAYINSQFVDEPQFLHLFDEPINDRTYSCLVKWKTGKLEICDVKFNRFIYNNNKRDPLIVQIREKGVANQIEFAVYGQRMAHSKYGSKTNESVEFDRYQIAHQFSDVRHLLELPNLNPKQKLPFPSDPGRPRYYFGREQKDDIWFGEAEILENRNLRKAALSGSVELNTLHSGLGASHDQIEAAMEKHRYTHTTHPTSPLKSEGIPVHRTALGHPDDCEWRFVSGEEQYVEVVLRENRYPCTMVGLDRDGKFHMFAWNGIYSQEPGLTLRQSARIMCQHGVTDAILCDEGEDVFQYISDGNDLIPIIEPKRGQIRAALVVARRIRD
uniref:Phosphodiester glycosidase domain-containing protein n=1 Tax=Candidatus Kentrum sp. FM TaxID=2126340 RepID=A0A450TTL1_9GAMM|nr:MAG: Predicted protein (DUF2233) [Candidatus Kentron sp. FM]VFJ72075.1 MAG: Predicted protein (DUF2233) [Candidatus Kentron sp. FM]VFK10506.1 MAG: Predicted protein (DUF2233) [Candidatus Kentron sp. FM]